MAGMMAEAGTVTRSLGVYAGALNLLPFKSGGFVRVREKKKTLAPQFFRLLSRTAPKVKVKRVVYVSKSRDIFDNLALEEWLYEKGDLIGNEYLLMWRNQPAIVIGRHQNPWTECNITKAQQKGVDVARRNSGGGTVFHDEGNLNLSFLKPRSQYDRRQNLALVVQALTSTWHIDLEMNSRDDLILDGIYKVSGTASKLGGERTYHHFTLMLDVDTGSLHSLLHTPLLGVDSKATSSVPSLVKNLKESAPEMTADSVFQVVGQEFLKDEAKSEQCIHFVDPCDEQLFPGVLVAKQRLQSWEWIFGKTPPFSITRTFAKPCIYLAHSASHLSQHSFSDLHISTTTNDGMNTYCNGAAVPGGLSSTSDNCSIRVHVAVQKGHIHELSADFVHGCTSLEGTALQARLPQIGALTGKPLESEGFKKLWESVHGNLKNEKSAADHRLLVWGVECLKLCLPCPGTANKTENKVLQFNTVHS